MGDFRRHRQEFRPEGEQGRAVRGSEAALEPRRHVEGCWIQSRSRRLREAGSKWIHLLGGVRGQIAGSYCQGDECDRRCADRGPRGSDEYVLLRCRIRDDLQRWGLRSTFSRVNALQSHILSYPPTVTRGGEAFRAAGKAPFVTHAFSPLVADSAWADASSKHRALPRA